MVNWHSLETVFLYMDGTLLDLHFDNHFWLEHLPRRYAEYNNLSPEEARDTIIPMIMMGKMEMELPLMYMMNRFIGSCLIGARAMFHDRLDINFESDDWLPPIKLNF